MRSRGSRPSPVKLSASLMLGFALASPAAGQVFAIEAPLTGAPGDAGRGRAIVASRQAGLCVLCHAGPFGEAHLQGNLAPDLRGVGGRLTPGEIRLRLVEPAAANPDSIMPSYRRSDGLSRPGRGWAGKPILSDVAIEDVVAYLATLKEE